MPPRLPQLGPWVFLALSVGALGFTVVDRSFPSRTASSCPASADMRYEVVVDALALREHRVTLRELVDSLRTAIGRSDAGPTPWAGPATIPIVVTQRYGAGATDSVELRVPRWVAHDLDLRAVVVRWRPSDPPVRVGELARIRLVETLVSSSSCRSEELLAIAADGDSR